ncbi:MAG: pyruvate kinase [Clostridiales bacterium]|nr:pyruvate kinase [Clostridiales bacterium]
MKRTKIVCTVGPAIANKEILKRMMKAGMNVARFNFSHGSYAEQSKYYAPFVEAREELGIAVASLLDTQGPEIRTGVLTENPTMLEAENEFTLVNEDIIGDASKVSVTYKDLYKDVKPGTTILIDDGKIELEVIRIEEKDVVCKIMNGGELGNRKSINVPGTHINLPALKDKDIADLIAGCENDFDYIAASFIRCAEDVLAIRKVLNENGGEKIKIISKIESQEGINNFDSILEVSDGIMVARGDMGVEIPMEQVPIVQKEIIKKCNKAGKIVITATQMLESMTTNPRPTRAEVSDVANAIFDITGAIMLSGESAMGKYPVLCVETMSKIAVATENDINYEKRLDLRNENFEYNNYEFHLNRAICSTAKKMNAKCIFAYTEGGDTPKMLASFMPCCPIYAVTKNAKTYRQLALVNNVTPILVKDSIDINDTIIKGIEIAKQNGDVLQGDIIAIAGGNKVLETSDFTDVNRTIGGVIKI